MNDDDIYAVKLVSHPDSLPRTRYLDGDYWVSHYGRFEQFSALNTSFLTKESALKLIQDLKNKFPLADFEYKKISFTIEE